MKRNILALLMAACATTATAQEAEGERYFGGLVNVLVAPDSARELDGIGLHALYGGGRLLGLPVEYRAFYDTLEPKNGPNMNLFRSGLGADLRFDLGDFGMVTPFALGGGGLVYSDAVPDGDKEFDGFANVGLGLITAPLTLHNWRIRGDLKYVYENLGEGYFDLHAALGVHIPLGGAAAAAPGEAVEVVPAEEDSDGDGVGDSRDQCPGTPSGGRVMKDGCEPKAVVELPGVTFESNSDQLSEGSSTILDEAAATLNTEHANAQVEVAGHTDDSGNAGYNMGLSERRAETVRQYLITQGVDESRLSAEGYGETQPVGDNSTTEGKAANRRVELRVR